MELISREEVIDFSPYHSAPTSPNVRSLHSMFTTAPSSPVNDKLATPENDGLSSNSDDFEFETSQRFDNYIELEILQDFECSVEDQRQRKQGMKPKGGRGGSLPTMAFADELFYNGLVMPLKPPPRLQFSDENASFGQGSIPQSPTSPQTSGFKVPFVHRVAWIDDFDPFKVAVVKVSEESRGKTSEAGSHHRQSRSHSPFRTHNSMDKNFDQQILAPKFGLPKEPKGSPYARFVIDQNKQVEQRAKGRKGPEKFPFGKRVRLLKTDYEGPKRTSSKIVENDWNDSIVVVETGMQRIRSVLLKYASFGRENSDDKATKKWKPNFKRLSVKFKRHGTDGSGNGKKRSIEEGSKMEVIEYKRSRSSLALCFYGFECH